MKMGQDHGVQPATKKHRKLEFLKDNIEHPNQSFSELDPNYLAYE